MNYSIIIFFLILIFLNKNIENFEIISSGEAKKLISQNKIKTILDVRSNNEWNKGHHPKAINIPIEPKNNITKNSIKNLKEPILIYCRSGRRAKNAAKLMKKFNFNKIFIINDNYKSIL